MRGFGLSIGPAINFYENGNIESELNYLEGQLHGIQAYYYENGHKKSQSNHQNG